MGKLTKIHITYEIKEPFPLFVEPGNNLEGRVVVTNNGEKDLKLKELFIELMDVWDEDSSEGWNTRKRKLSTYYINTKGMIKAGETQYYPFNIRLSRWKRRKGRRINNWHVALYFKQKTKLVASRGSIKRNATCILPVLGTMMNPSFGDPAQVYGIKKKRRG